VYGYLAVFVGSLLEGESLILLAGLLSYQDHLSFSMILLCAFAGAVIGDTAWFLVGKYAPSTLTNRFAILSSVERRAVFLVGSRQKVVAFLMRFMYGFRMLVPFALGRSSMKLHVFVLCNVLGALVWVLLFSLLGYMFGSIAEAIIGRLRKYELSIIVAVVLAVATGGLVYRAARHIAQKKIIDETFEK
jgi:membrane protein DedA with SNARE-associated domain